jgi:hypothetical protein
VQQDQPVNLEQQERLESLAQLERQDRPGRLEQQDHKVHQHQKNIKRWILGDILLAGVSPFFIGVSSLKLWRDAGPLNATLTISRFRQMLRLIKSLCIFPLSLKTV